MTDGFQPALAACAGFALLAARKGMLPVNAGFLGTDDSCRLSLVLGEALPATPEFTMSLNAAFGGANTALVIGLP